LDAKRLFLVIIGVGLVWFSSSTVDGYAMFVTTLGWIGIIMVYAGLDPVWFARFSGEEARKRLRLSEEVSDLQSQFLHDIFDRFGTDRINGSPSDDWRRAKELEFRTLLAEKMKEIDV
jgi:hypothetical protein